MTTRAATSTRTVVVALLAALVASIPAPAASATAPAPAPTTAPAAPGASAAKPPAGARLLACRRSPSIERRSALVGTWMRPLPTGTRLAVQIELWQRTRGTSWTLRSDVPGLGSWISPSDPLVGTRPGDVFKYRQAVGRLLAPAAYRFRVAFRWSDAAGAVVRQASLATRTCRQPDLRPDLVLDAVSAAPSPGGDGLVRYEVSVRNAGHSAAPRSSVAATLPGETTPNDHLRPLPRLAPGASATVAFSGPGCAAGGDPATFVADPANAVDESDEANNELAATCPAP